MQTCENLKNSIRQSFQNKNRGGCVENNCPSLSREIADLGSPEKISVEIFFDLIADGEKFTLALLFVVSY